MDSSVMSFFPDAAGSAARMLSAETDQDTYDAATKVCQVFSGIFFTLLVLWLSFTNGTKLSYIQQASLEKRLLTCCFLCTYVGAFSAFFNFFQLTEVDNFDLDRESSFTLDFARPLEWIMTCPLMQLVLVLMGGSRIPEYRRMMMPGLSVLTLFCGTASMLTTGAANVACFIIGAMVASVMFYFNRVQILEHSAGEECLLFGDSEFRKASLILVFTWVPFPLFYSLSPEGFGVITNILVIQAGWAFLNIVAKFSFIFYIQRVKDNYCSRLKAKREMYSGNIGAIPGQANEAWGGDVTPMGNGQNNAAAAQARKAEGELGAIVIETLNFLGMAQHGDRFMRLLHSAEVRSVDQVEHFTKEECDKLKIPWDLISAVQKRLKVWKLEMTDDAEQALERGEAHYQQESTVQLSAVAEKLQGHYENQNQNSASGSTTPVTGGGGTSVMHVNADAIQTARLDRLEELMSFMQQQNERFQAAGMGKTVFKQ
ncbi:unnamed protein product [Polarella glacialis]|uniref:Uncharacterized protein n=1 Tax=Polarella glacialis TaxID=89957 RepID=A0A813G5U9_POLGL|nr:unnamed protein product [Polarella glacialis]